MKARKGSYLFFSLATLMILWAFVSSCGQKEREAFALAKGEGSFEAYERFVNEYPENPDGLYALAVAGLVTGRDPQSDPVLARAVGAAPERVRHGYDLRNEYRDAAAAYDECNHGCSTVFLDCSQNASDEAGQVDYEALDRCTKLIEGCLGDCDELVFKARERADTYKVELKLIEHDASLPILALEREEILVP